MRRTISSRWATTVTSRAVATSSISCAVRVPDTSSSRSLYRSSVARAWLARDRIAAESSSTYRAPSRYRAMIRMDLLTEITGQPAEPGRGERHPQLETAAAHLVHGGPVTQHDQRAGVPAQDALQPVAEHGARGQRGQGGPAARLPGPGVPVPGLPDADARAADARAADARAADARVADVGAVRVLVVVGWRHKTPGGCWTGPVYRRLRPAGRQSAAEGGGL